MHKQGYVSHIENIYRKSHMSFLWWEPREKMFNPPPPHWDRINSKVNIQLILFRMARIKMRYFIPTDRFIIPHFNQCTVCLETVGNSEYGCRPFPLVVSILGLLVFIRYCVKYFYTGISCSISVRAFANIVN